jgi:hypothetical protein
VPAKPKQLKERSLNLTVQPFGYRVKVIVSNNVHLSAHKRIPGIQIDDSWAACHCGITNQLVSFIFLPSNVTAGTIAHEVFHCTWHIMRQIGADHENEVMAYTLSYLVDEIAHFVRGKKTKNRKRKKQRSGNTSS